MGKAALKVYVASAWKDSLRVNLVRSGLSGAGFDVSGPQQQEENAAIVGWRKDWVEWADVVVMITPSGRLQHFEAGYAKGIGKPLVVMQNNDIVDDAVNDLFYPPAYACDLMTSSFAAILQFLEKLQEG